MSVVVITLVREGCCICIGKPKWEESSPVLGKLQEAEGPARQSLYPSHSLAKFRLPPPSDRASDLSLKVGTRIRGCQQRQNLTCNKPATKNWLDCAPYSGVNLADDPMRLLSLQLG